MRFDQGRLALCREDLELLKLASSLARKAKDSDLRKETLQRSKEIRALQQAYKKVKVALDILKEKPDDPAANLEAGKFFFLFKGDSAKGLPMLARGSDSTLKSLAKLDLSNPTEPTKQAALGDSWWNFGQAQKEPAKIHALIRAGQWYEDALPKLSGIAKAQTKRRLGEIEKVAGPLSVYLAEKTPTFLRSQNQSIHLDDRTVGGVKVIHGVFIYPPEPRTSALASFDLNRAYRKLTGSVALIDYRVGSASALTFRVVGDGKLLWISNPVQKTGITQEFKINVSRIEKLELFVDCPGSRNFAHAMWIDPKLSK